MAENKKVAIVPYDVESTQALFEIIIDAIPELGLSFREVKDFGLVISNAPLTNEELEVVMVAYKET